MAFNISDFLGNEENVKDSRKDFRIRKIHISKLRPAQDKENFYHIDDEEVELIARTIEVVGVQQNTVVKPIKDTDEYEIIAGHKRYYAQLRLVSEGKKEYEYVYCKIEDTGDDIRNELILIFTNSTQRDRNDFDKIKEIKRIKVLLDTYQENGGELKGRKRDIIAAILKTTKSKIGRLENIANNLIDDFMKAFENGEINVSTANEIAGMTQNAQMALFDIFKETGKLRQEDVKNVKESENSSQGICGATQEPCNFEELKKVAKSLGAECKTICCVTCQEPCGAQCNYASERNYEMKEGQELEEKAKAAAEEEYFEPAPDKIESICYSCLHWDECDQKSSNVADCKDYINKQDALKTDEQRAQEAYDKQQEQIDKQTQKVLQEKEDQEKLDKVPSVAEKKIHDLKVSSIDFSLITEGTKQFMVEKYKGYEEGDLINLIEYSKGETTGGEFIVRIKYLEKENSGLKDDYCVMGVDAI